MELAKYKACICEGSAESAIMDILLDNDLLIIFHEDKYRQFKKSGKRPSEFCKEDLEMPDVKSYSFVKKYFADPAVLVAAIKKYHSISKIKKGEYTLLDLLRV